MSAVIILLLQGEDKEQAPAQEPPSAVGEFVRSFSGMVIQMSAVWGFTIALLACARAALEAVFVTSGAQA